MIWGRLKYFRKSENWGNPDKMSIPLLLILDMLREELKCEFVVHCGWASSGHATKSKHYSGEAVDFHVVGMSLLVATKQMLECLKTYNINFGFGLYTDNAWPKSHGGFHLDIRPEMCLWICNEVPKYNYFYDIPLYLKNISL